LFNTSTCNIFFFLILDIPVGMYVQKYILLFLVVQSQPTHTHLQYVIMLPVSAQRAIIRPMTQNHENQTLYILIRGKLPFFAIIYI
jgi:hypothetical protein